MKNLLLLLLFSTLLKSQTPTLKWHGEAKNKTEFTNKMVKTADGGTLIVGKRANADFSNFDAFLLKLDQNGNQTWLKTFDEIHDEEAFDVVVLPNEEIVFCGQSTSKDGEKSAGFIIKTDKNGNKIWRLLRDYGDYRGITALRLSLDGNIWFGGFFIDFDRQSFFGKIDVDDTSLIEQNVPSSYGYGAVAIEEKVLNHPIISMKSNFDVVILTMNNLWEQTWLERSPATNDLESGISNILHTDIGQYNICYIYPNGQCWLKTLDPSGTSSATEILVCSRAQKVWFYENSDDIKEVLVLKTDRKTLERYAFQNETITPIGTFTLPFLIDNAVPTQVLQKTANTYQILSKTGKIPPEITADFSLAEVEIDVSQNLQVNFKKYLFEQGEQPHEFVWDYCQLKNGNYMVLVSDLPKTNNIGSLFLRKHLSTMLLNSDGELLEKHQNNVFFDDSTTFSQYKLVATPDGGAAFFGQNEIQKIVFFQLDKSGQVSQANEIELIENLSNLEAFIARPNGGFYLSFYTNSGERKRIFRLDEQGQMVGFLETGDVFDINGKICATEEAFVIAVTRSVIFQHPNHFYDQYLVIYSKSGAIISENKITVDDSVYGTYDIIQAEEGGFWLFLYGDLGIMAVKINAFGDVERKFTGQVPPFGFINYPRIFPLNCGGLIFEDRQSPNPIDPKNILFPRLINFSLRHISANSNLEPTLQIAIKNGGYEIINEEDIPEFALIGDAFHGTSQDVFFLKMGNPQNVPTTEKNRLAFIPNPSAGSTCVHFTSPHRGDITMKIFYESGQLVWEINDQKLNDSARISFNGGGLVGGTYFIQVLAGEERFFGTWVKI